MIRAGDAMKQEYRDARNIRFDDLRNWLPKQLSQWPTPPRVTKDRDGEQAKFHAEYGGTKCWYCLTETGTELHHLAAGSRGRSHERGLFCWTCNWCHANRTRESDLPVWLRSKCDFDKAGTDWVLLALRLGYFPPDITPVAVDEF